jgi:hypothetical protein
VCRDVAVHDPGTLRRQGRELVEVGREEAHAVDLRDDVLRDRPRDTEPIERGCSLIFKKYILSHRCMRRGCRNHWGR